MKKLGKKKMFEAFKRMIKRLLDVVNPNEEVDWEAISKIPTDASPPGLPPEVSRKLKPST